MNDFSRFNSRLKEPRLPRSSLVAWSLFALLVVFITWASLFQLDEVTTGSGKVIPSSHEQVIQSLEGGIIHSLMVREGDIVERGQQLAQLDRTKTESSVLESESRLNAAMATAARLNAEVNDTGHMKDLVLGVVSHSFRPEFINRIDEVVVFHPLGEKHIASIAQIQLQRLYKRLEERGYETQISDEALQLLSKNGYDPVYGARPLKRAIQQQIENPLAQQILSGELLPGKTIRLEVKDDQIVAVQ